MTYKTDNVIIVGGGSAGWMSAATLISLFPNKNITLLESPKDPRIGVGESTLQSIRGWLKIVGIHDTDFMKDTDATYKLSIKFTDFYKKDAGGFHYPFGRVHVPPVAEKHGLNTWFIKKALYPETPVEDYCRSFYPQTSLFEKNKISNNEDGSFGGFNLKTDSSFHFDATKFACWLRDNFCIPRGVNYVRGTVKKVNTDSDGVSGLVLDDGTVLTADLYVDCTGFKSLLLGDALKEPFISYEKTLPNNRAWATQVPYIDKEKELEPYTNCTAIDNGWVWNIPSWSRIGTGYVYSDKFISKEDALDQFKQHLKTRMTVKDAERIDDQLKFKDIQIKTGIHERIWVKNVIAIGLSAGFIEPLESNGLHTVHEFLIFLTRFLHKDHVSRFDQDMYNRMATGTFDNFAQFVSMHYALSNRSDTDYWRDISRKCFDENVYKRIPVVSLGGFSEFADRHMNTREHNPTHGIHCISTGLNYFPIDIHMIRHQELHDGDGFYESMIQECDKVWDYLKYQTSMVADKCPSHYEYLKNTIYSE